MERVRENVDAAPRSGLRWPVVVFGVLIGLALIGLVFKFTNVHLKDVADCLGRARPGFLVSICATTALHFAVTAYKWRIATTSMYPEIGFRKGFFAYTALIALMGQVMPFTLAATAGRSAVLRLHRNVPVRHGIVLSLYDSAFDFLIPLLVFVPAPLYVSGKISLSLSVTLSVIAVAAFGAVVILTRGRFFRNTLSILLRFRLFRLLAGVASDEARKALERGMLSTSTIAKLYFLSVVRFFNLVLRFWCVVWATGLNVAPLSLVYIAGVGVFSLLLSVTPGALGVTEWGIIGVLAVCGVDKDVAGVYAVLCRILFFLAVLLVTVATFCVFAAWRCVERSRLFRRDAAQP